MSDVAELRSLQTHYTERRDWCYSAITRQDQDLLNCTPSASLIRQCRERERLLREDAQKWQDRIDAIQVKLDEAIGLS